jgi:hypothetical protein
MESTDMKWRKSSYSGNGGETCVEVADHDGTVHVRDTKDHGNGQIHRFTAEQWCAFVASVKTTNLPAGQRASVSG